MLSSGYIVFLPRRCAGWIDAGMIMWSTAPTGWTRRNDNGPMRCYVIDSRCFANNSSRRAGRVGFTIACREIAQANGSQREWVVILFTQAGGEGASEERGGKKVGDAEQGESRSSRIPTPMVTGSRTLQYSTHALDYDRLCQDRASITSCRCFNVSCIRGF